jgi:hypothetical protein
MKTTLVTLFAALLIFGIAHAQEGAVQEDLIEQLEERQGQPIDTLRQAVDTLTLHNDLLKALLDKQQLTEVDMAIIKDLTATIEDALAKVDAELGIMREQVKKVRAGADAREQDHIRESGKDYLERIHTLMR